MTNNFFTCWLLIPGHILWIDMSLIRLDVFFYIWYRFRGQWDTPVNYMNKFLVLGNVITCARFCLKQMWRLTKAIAKMKCEHWTKRWNWSSCTKLALSVYVNMYIYNIFNLHIYNIYLIHIYIYICSIIHLFFHYLHSLSFSFLLYCFYCCFLLLWRYCVKFEWLVVDFPYHFIGSHLILVICSIPMLIVHLISKKIFNKIL